MSRRSHRAQQHILLAMAERVMLRPRFRAHTSSEYTTRFEHAPMLRRYRWHGCPAQFQNQATLS